MVKDTTLSNTRLRHCAWVSSFHTLFNTLLPPLPSLKSLKGGGGLQECFSQSQEAGLVDLSGKNVF